MVGVFRHPSTSLFRVVLLNIMGVLYLVFIVIFGVRLHAWDDNVAGACYHTRLLSTPSSKHPLADELYLAITSLYFFAALGLSMEPQQQRLMDTLESLRVDSRESRPELRDVMIGFISFILTGTSLPLSKLFWTRLAAVRSIPKSYGLEQIRHRMDSLLNKISSKYEASPWLGMLLVNPLKTAVTYPKSALTTMEENDFAILLLALIQCPVHGYMIFALRASNESHLSGDSENQWGFGQIVPLVLLISVATECIQALVGKDYLCAGSLQVTNLPVTGSRI